MGPDHPNVAFVLNDLALLRVAQGRYSEAEPLFLRALALREKGLGPNHPDLARTLRDYATLLRSMDRAAEAAELEARAAEEAMLWPVNLVGGLF